MEKTIPGWRFMCVNNATTKDYPHTLYAILSSSEMTRIKSGSLCDVNVSHNDLASAVSIKTPRSQTGTYHQTSISL